MPQHHAHKLKGKRKASMATQEPTCKGGPRKRWPLGRRLAVPVGVRAVSQHEDLRV